MATKLLLLEDVDVLGRSGDIVSVKPGYARNFLLPQGLAMIADKQALRKQERLKQERQKKAEEDKKESQQVASRLEGITLTKVVKVDHDGHMYGSVSALDVIHLVQEQNQIELDKKSVALKQPIKKTGSHEITVKLKEGVTTLIHLNVISEDEFKRSQEEKTAAE